MTLEQQVVSLDLAKRLKELEVKQESLFYWCKGRFDQPDKSKWEINDSIDTHAHENISAFTVAELGEMLPKDEGHYHSDYTQYISYHSIYGEWICCDQYANKCGIHHASTEADARAKMLIYLLEQKIITI